MNLIFRRRKPIFSRQLRISFATLRVQRPSFAGIRKYPALEVTRKQKLEFPDQQLSTLIFIVKSLWAVYTHTQVYASTPILLMRIVLALIPAILHRTTLSTQNHILADQTPCCFQLSLFHANIPSLKGSGL